MNRKYIILTLVLLATLKGFVVAQAIFEPNYSLKTPETINIVSFETKQGSTVLNMSIENRIEGGYFCIDKNTYIITDQGERYKLEKTNGLPSCPEVHQFTRLGEVIYFTLIFPRIDPQAAWFDLVEDCGDMCFSILGISTDPSLNYRIDKCFETLEKGEQKEAAELFEALLPELEKTNHSITGSVYVNLVIIYQSLNDPKATYYHNRLKESSVPHKEKLLQGLMIKD